MFNSFIFVGFFAAIYAFYLALHRWYKAQNILLLVASYVFYGWWDPRFVLLMLFALAAQVFLRYVFGKSLSWSEELALLGFAWVIVITTAIGIRRMSHARMDLIIEVLPKGLHQSVERFSAVLMLALGLFLTYAGWGYVAETRGSPSATMGPVWDCYTVSSSSRSPRISRAVLGDIT